MPRRICSARAPVLSILSHCEENPGYRDFTFDKRLSERKQVERVVIVTRCEDAVTAQMFDDVHRKHHVAHADSLKETEVLAFIDAIWVHANEGVCAGVGMELRFLFFVELG